MLVMKQEFVKKLTTLDKIVKSLYLLSDHRISVLYLKFLKLLDKHMREMENEETFDFNKNEISKALGELTEEILKYKKLETN